MIQIKTIGNLELSFFEEMFYQSLFVRSGAAPFSPAIIHEPGLKKYILNWGRPNDYGYIAYDLHQEFGAVWARFFSEDQKSYGFVAANIPEMGIAVLSEYRGQGLGTALMKHLFEALKNDGIKQVSLSVDRENVRAIQLYERLGFKNYSIEGTAITMLNTFDE